MPKKHKLDCELKIPISKSFKPIDISKLIHKRQSKSSTLCRKYAIIAAVSGLKNIGSKLNDNIEISTEEYYKYCDEFDVISDLPIGTSRESTYNSGKESKYTNIFDYILRRHYNIKSRYISNYDEKQLDKFHEKFKKSSKRKNFCAIVFNLRHAWAIVRVDGKLCKIDSLKKEIEFIDELPTSCGYVILEQ